MTKYTIMSENIAATKKFNFWYENNPELGFERIKYLDKLMRFSGNRLIKVLVGQRRTGKSYILKQTIKRLLESGVQPENTIYINKEYLEFDFITDYRILSDFIEEYKQTLRPQGKIYIFVDEIQTIDGWERLVNSYSQNSADEYELYISGSNSQLLAGELATLLSGRYILFQIFPFSFDEFQEFQQIGVSKESYLKYLQSGALPELFHLTDIETKRYYVSAIKDTVLLRDIITRYKIKDAGLLEDIFKFLVNNASNLISISNIVNYYTSKGRKTNYETISTYISYIEQTFLIHKVERYTIKGKELLSGSYKYYANDPAYKNYLYAGVNYGIGSLLENVVYLQLLQEGFEVYTGAMRNREIDFVAIKNDQKLYFQVAYVLSDETTIEREYGVYKNIDDNYEKYVVTLDDVELPIRNGIRHVQAWKLSSILKQFNVI